MSDTDQHPDFVLMFVPVTTLSAYAFGTAINARFGAVMAAAGLCYLVIADGLFWHRPAE